jgi:hypothetical protein
MRRATATLLPLVFLFARPLVFLFARPLVFFFARHSSGSWNPALNACVLCGALSAELRLALAGEPVTFWQLRKK